MFIENDALTDALNGVGTELFSDNDALTDALNGVGTELFSGNDALTDALNGVGTELFSEKDALTDAINGVASQDLRHQLRNRASLKTKNKSHQCVQIREIDRLVLLVHKTHKNNLKLL